MHELLERLNEEADNLRDGKSYRGDDELADLLGEAAAEITELRATIEAVEWIGMQDECAWCGGFGKHALKCRRQYALGLV